MCKKFEEVFSAMEKGIRVIDFNSQTTHIDLLSWHNWYFLLKVLKKMYCHMFCKPV